jgi:hypothetical protein
MRTFFGQQPAGAADSGGACAPPRELFTPGTAAVHAVNRRATLAKSARILTCSVAERALGVWEFENRLQEPVVLREKIADQARLLVRL